MIGISRAAVFTALLAGTGIPGLAAAAPSACQLIQIASLPVTMQGNQPIIDGRINGKPARLLVDTGAFATIIWRSAAPTFGIRETTRSTAKVYGVGGGSEVSEATLEEIKLGETSAHNVHVVVTGQGSIGADGVLGADFLSPVDVEYDFAGGAMRLLHPKNCVGDQVVYWGKAYSVLPIIASSGGQDIVVPAALDGHTVRATMDTGASNSVVTTWTAEQVGVTPHSKGIVRSDQSHGVGAQHVETYVGVFPTFSFGDETIKNARLQIADLFHADKEVEIGRHIATSVIETPSMLLGADFFLSHRVYVARSQNKVYVSYQGGPVFEVPNRAEPPKSTAPAGR